ncbi:MAG: phosphate ABC transporter permease PstA [Phycisphaerae bacterium]|nr:phosphate ABC transporter permease PstA [Phycisphaerae bacterium]
MSDPADIPAKALFVATPAVRRRLRSQRVAVVCLSLASLAIFLPLAAVLIGLVKKALPALTWEFIVDVPRKGMTAGGIWPALVGTLYFVTLSLLAAAPIGILAGIYLNEFARDNWLTRVINLAVVNLSGVPSIVHALFGVAAFVIMLRWGQSIRAASATLAVMVLPVIIVATKEALSAVPRSFREACWNVGATRWQTIRTVVLPNSIGGILTGVILAVSRAAGETAPIMVTGAIFYKVVARGDLFPYSINEQGMALSYHLYQISRNVPNMPESMLYATALVLVVFVLAFNSVATVLRVRLRRRKKW